VRYTRDRLFAIHFISLRVNATRLAFAATAWTHHRCYMASSGSGQSLIRSLKRATIVGTMSSVQSGPEHLRLSRAGLELVPPAPQVLVEVPVDAPRRSDVGGIDRQADGPVARRPRQRQMVRKRLRR